MAFRGRGPRSPLVRLAVRRGGAREVVRVEGAEAEISRSPLAARLGLQVPPLIWSMQTDFRGARMYDMQIDACVGGERMIIRKSRPTAVVMYILRNYLVAVNS